eukprot:GEZU01028060.1.p1 GENE.GEZU01028060.1~~GEZU01028060.1.p1  ORF type:complete len:1005 (-),score=379.00 GEZU01028060.1:294-3308(-)
MDMKGLSVFISDIRKATSKEEEQKRVDKELAKIRQKFKNSSNLKGYDRKKYVTKLLYMHMLGYEIDFGHMEAVNLLSSDKYSEKHLGYLACTLLLNENHELLTLITNSIKQDLVNKNVENFQCLALCAIANVGGKDFAEALAQDVQKILVAGETKSLVRKKAALCLLRLYRKYPEILPPDTWSERVINLLSGRDLGVITSVMALLLELVASSPADYEKAIPKVVRLLTKLVINREYTNDYIYYGIPTPWLQIKLLRLLQFYPPPEAELMTQITAVLNRIINGAERIRTMDKTKSVSRNNAVHSVLFEALKLAIHYDNDRELLNTAANILGRFLSDRDTNLRYLSLDTMSRLALTTGDAIEHIKKHQDTILFALKDPDISIRKRALDLLYSMCDKSNASQIVGELLSYLAVADFAIREELVLKIAILAEKFASDLTWYVDVVLNLITQAGDFVSDDIWYRVVQIVTNSDESLQRYAADTVLKAVSSPAAHENCVKVAGYILGEFGHLIADVDVTGPAVQFNALRTKFDVSTSPTRALLLSTFIKFYNMYEDPEVRSKIIDVFKSYRSYIDAEIQQRANEYYALAGTADESLLAAVLEAMPNFPERESNLLRGLKIGAASRVDGQQAGEDGGAHLGTIREPSQTELQSAQAPAQQQASTLLSLDDLLGGPVAAPAPQPSTLLQEQARLQQQPTPVAVDPFDFGFSSPTAAPAPAPAPVPVAAPAPVDLAAEAARAAAQRQYTAGAVESMIGKANQAELEEQLKAVQEDAAKKFVKLIVGDSGVAMEQSHLQLGVKSEFHGNVGRMVLYFGNKQQAPLAQVRATLDSIPELKIQASQVAPMIAPKTQVQQFINIECLDAFSGNATLSLYFEYERQPYKFTLQVPVTLNKFTEPLRITSAEDFFKRWNAIQGGAPLEQVKTGKSASPIDMQKLDQMFTTGFKLAVLPFDPNPNNLVCAGLVCTKAGQHGLLVRLQTHKEAQAFKLTVRSTNATVSTTIADLIYNQLLL